MAIYVFENGNFEKVTLCGGYIFISFESLVSGHIGFRMRYKNKNCRQNTEHNGLLSNH